MLEGAHTTAKEVLSRIYPKNSGVDVQLDETRYCVNKIEYMISKILLYDYICSVTEQIGQKNVDDVLEFLRGHVKVHEHNYVFYLRKEIRHYEEYSNSSHEGTNGGLKYCAGAVIPMNKFDKSVTKLCN